MSTKQSVSVVRVVRSRGLPAESIRLLRQSVVFEALEARRVLSAAIAHITPIIAVTDPLCTSSIVISPTPADSAPADDAGNSVNGDDPSSDDASDDTDLSTDDSADDSSEDVSDDASDDVDDTSADDTNASVEVTATDEPVDFATVIDVTPTAPVIVVSGKTLSGTIAMFTLGDSAAKDFTLSLYVDDTDASSAAAIVDNGDGTASIVLGTPVDVTRTDGSAAELSYSINDDARSLYGYGTSVVISSATNKGPLLTMDLTSPDEQWVETSADAQSISIGDVFDQGGTDASAYTVTVNWGDGTSSPGTIEANGEGTLAVGGDHAYPKAGTYHVSATVARSDGTASLDLATDVAVTEPEIFTPPIETIGGIGGIDWSFSDGMARPGITPRPFVRGTSLPAATDIIETAVTPTAPALRANFGAPATELVFERSPSIASDMFASQAIDPHFATGLTTQALTTDAKHKKDGVLDIV